MDSSLLRGKFAILVLSILELSWATACPAETLPPAERPEPKIGDSAVFRNLDLRTGEKRDTSMVIIRIDADKIVNETSGSTSGTRTYTRDYNLLEIKTGEKAGSLGSNQVEQLEKGYVGATRRLVVYEAGAFDGEPYNLPPDAPSWQDVRFGFTSSLVVLAERK